MKRPSKTIVFVVACILLAMPMSGCLDPSDEDDEPDEPWKNYVKFSSIDMNGTKAWSIWFYVGVEPENGTEWFWDDSVVVLSGPEGDEPITIIPRFGNVEPDVGTYAYYEIGEYPENRTTPYNISGGDGLTVTGVTSAYLNGAVKLKIGNDVITSISIPKELKEDVEMKLEFENVYHNTWNDSISWNLDLRPNITNPSTFPMFWDTLRAGIIGPDGTYLVAPRPFSWGNSTGHYEDFKESMEIDFRFYDYLHTDLWYHSYRLITPEESWQRNCISDEGDKVMVMGLTKNHEGGRVVIYKGIDRIAESAPIGPLDNPFSNVTMGTPVITTKLTNYTMLHTATIDIEEIELVNASHKILWSSARVLVKDVDGDVLANSTVIVWGGGDFCDTFEAYSDRYIDVNDELILLGLNLSFRGANVELFISGMSVENVSIPDLFNISGIQLATSMSTPKERKVGNETLYDLRVSVWSTRPRGKTIPWDQIRARVVDRINDTILIDLTEPLPFESDLADEPDIFYRVHDDDNSTEDHQAFFYISALNRTFEDTYLELFLGDEMVGWENLEGPFNISSLPVFFNLASPHIDEVGINGTTYYCLILNINKITPKTADCLWDNITLEIEGPSGFLLLPAQVVGSNIVDYDEDDTDGIDVELWYVETGAGIKASAGDTFKITGLTKEFEGAQVFIYLDGVKIGSSTLQSDWP